MKAYFVHHVSSSATGLVGPVSLFAARNSLNLVRLVSHFPARLRRGTRRTLAAHGEAQQGQALGECGAPHQRVFEYPTAPNRQGTRRQRQQGPPWHSCQGCHNGKCGQRMADQQQTRAECVEDAQGGIGRAVRGQSVEIAFPEPGPRGNQYEQTEQNRRTGSRHREGSYAGEKARTFGKPYMGMTARFHKSWADFGGLKPAAALEYETSQMMAHGAQCSIGDQLHPRGTLDRGAYDLIGQVYKRVADREPWLTGAVPVAQIGLFQVPSGVLSTTQSSSGTDEGATRMLTQLKHQFDVVSDASDFSRYELLILPDTIALTPALIKRLRAYIKQGGALLATGISGLDSEGRKLLLPELGIRPEGLSPFTATYIRFDREVADGVPASDHIMYDRGIRVTAGRGAKVLARVVEPYFERAWNHFCSHKQTPGDKLSRFAAAVQHGRCGTIPFPIFGAYAQHGNVPYRLLVEKLLNRLLPAPLLRVTAPTSTEATVTRQKNRTIIHLLQYCPERRAAGLDLVEDVVPVFSVPVSVRLAMAPRQVYLAPGREPIPFSYQDGRVNFTVPELRGHAMIVLDGTRSSL